MGLIAALIFVISTAYASEHRRKIVVIDTGLGWHQDDAPFICRNSSYSTVDKSIYDDHGHGTNIIGIISKSINYNKWCISSIKYGGMPSYLKALRMVLVMPNVGIVNLSIQGHAPDSEEALVLNILLRRGIKVVVAAGNHKSNLNVSCNVWPACYKTRFKSDNYIVVGGYNTSWSNQGAIITNWRPGLNQGFPKMTGTSQATANMTSELSK